MFMLFCKDSGCVLVKSSEHPSKTLNLIDNLSDHFEIKEFAVNEADYLGKAVKIINGFPTVIGNMTEEVLKDFCDDCPSYVK